MRTSSDRLVASTCDRMICARVPDLPARAVAVKLRELRSECLHHIALGGQIGGHGGQSGGHEVARVVVTNPEKWQTKGSCIEVALGFTM